MAIFTDNGKRGDTFDRPDYKALEAFISKHKPKVSYLIVTSHDRFSRNLGEALSKIRELQEKFQLKVLAINEDIHLDTDDPLVFMQRAFAYLLANQELLQIRKRTKDSIRHAKLSGRHVGKPPFGYTNARDRQHKTVLLIDEDKADIIRNIFRNYLAGRSIMEIRTIARQEGFDRLGNSAIQKVLHNPVYAGLIRIPACGKQSEQYVRGIHQPIIKEADFWLVKQKSKKTKPPKSRAHELFPLRGVLKCWCGRNMTAGYSKGRKKYYPYYRCTLHTGANYNGDRLHGQFEQLLDTFKFSETHLSTITVKAEEMLRKTVRDQKAIIASRNSQLLEIEKKQNTLDGLILNREIDSQTYNRLYQKLEMDREILAASKKEAMKESEKWVVLHALLSKIKSLKDVYKIATLSQKHTLIRGVFLHNLLYENGGFKISQ